MTPVLWVPSEMLVMLTFPAGETGRSATCENSRPANCRIGNYRSCARSSLQMAIGPEPFQDE